VELFTQAEALLGGGTALEAEAPAATAAPQTTEEVAPRGLSSSLSSQTLARLAQVLEMMQQRQRQRQDAARMPSGPVASEDAASASAGPSEVPLQATPAVQAGRKPGGPVTSEAAARSSSASSAVPPPASPVTVTASAPRGGSGQPAPEASQPVGPPPTAVVQALYGDFDAAMAEGNPVLGVWECPVIPTRPAHSTCPRRALRGTSW